MGATWTLALLFTCAGAIGCSSSGGEDAGLDLGVGSGSLALVRLERFPPTETGPARLVADAKVARYSGLDGSSVLKLLGADVRDGEGCILAGRFDDLSLAPDSRVELLSVGPLALRTGEVAQTFSPRLFPELATTASGWFYAGNTELPAARAEGEEYALSAQGEHGVGRFELAVGAPNEVLGLELGGVKLDPEAALTRTRDLSLTWEPEDLSDRVELEIYAGGAVLSCSARDDGQFVLPHAKLASLEQDAHGSLVLRRVRVMFTDMQGIETAYVRIATTRTLPIQVE